jgi:hypothetical protein
MRTFPTLLIAGILLATSGLASAQMRIRGTITAIDATTISVKSRTGEDLKMALDEKLGVAVATAVKFEDIKPGDYVGSAAMKGADGKLVALEVHYLAATVPSGFTPWDLEPGSTMTNANVVEAKVQSAGARELQVKYKDGEQTIVVPPNAPIVRAVPGTKDDLKVGEYVFVVAQKAADGKMTALRVQVSKNGVKPPQ